MRRFLRDNGLSVTLFAQFPVALMTRRSPDGGLTLKNFPLQLS
jgi:hypothetical protein